MDTEDNIDWSRAHTMRDIRNPQLTPAAPPKVDAEVSKVVGHSVYVNDRRLIALVNKWRKDSNPDKVDRYLDSEEKRAELRAIFN